MNTHQHRTLTKRLYHELARADKQWITRRRKITTASVFSQLTYACFERRGLKHTLQKSECAFTSQAFSKARRKLPAHLFSDINKSLQVAHGPRIFAVDGSKIHVHPSYLQQACVSRTNNKDVPRPAKRPLMMLSSMFDVHSRTCFDSQITKHFNERISAVQHFQAANPGDLLLFDRGYFSQELIQYATNSGLKVLFRVKCDALKSVKQFYHSSRTSALVHTTYQGTFSKAYLYKYYIDNKQYVCMTNFESSVKKIKQLYALRWRVETSFRRLKTDLSLETAHSMTTEGFVQEIEARILFDTFSILSSSNTPHGDAEPTFRRAAPQQIHSYFVALDAALRIFFAIEICHEQGIPCRGLWGLLQKRGGILF